MKKLFCLMLISTLSCSKVKESTELSGKWELRHAISGWFGPMTFLPGNGNIYKFTDKEYEYFVQHALVENGTYTTGRDTPQHIRNVPTEMDFMILQRGKLYYEISDNTLTIYDGDIALDGAIETYARVK